MELDLESEMQSLLAEETYLSGLIDQLSELRYRKGYDTLLKDTTKLLDKLKDRKELIQENIQDLTDNIIMTAEAAAGDYSSPDDTVDNYI